MEDGRWEEKNFDAISQLSGPEILIAANPPVPGGVHIAQIVSDKLNIQSKLYNDSLSIGFFSTQSKVTTKSDLLKSLSKVIIPRLFFFAIRY